MKRVGFALERLLKGLKQRDRRGLRQEPGGIVQFFGTATGGLLTIGMLLFWFVIPLYFAGRYFRKKDF